MSAHTYSFTERKRLRKSFGRLTQQTDMPNLIQVQRNSYENFLQMYIKAEDRQNVGLQAVLKEIFPVSDFNKKASLNFVKYELDESKYDVDECRQRGMTYEAPMRVTLMLAVFEIDEITGSRNLKYTKEEEVFMGNIPLMTERGTFIINGSERAVVSQMQRSPGVFFDQTKAKTYNSNKILHSARVIPYRGSWLEFEFDTKIFCKCELTVAVNCQRQLCLWRWIMLKQKLIVKNPKPTEKLLTLDT